MSAGATLGTKRGSGMDGLLIAHVADSIERISGDRVKDYDATADLAAELLSSYPEVAGAAQRYSAQALSDAGLDAIMRQAAGRPDWQD